MIALLLLGCTGEEGKGDLGVAGAVSATRPLEDGTTETVVGVAQTMKAFGVNTAGKVAVLLSPNASATCEDAATYLTGPGDDWNPEVINGVGTCSVYLTGAYEGSLSAVDDPIAVTIALNCAMGEGEWVYEERDEGDVGYYYDGAWWIGSPESFTLELSGGDEQDYALDLSMIDYSGSFTYDVWHADNDPATGTVAGSTTVEWCAAMGPGLAR